MTIVIINYHISYFFWKHLINMELIYTAIILITAYFYFRPRAQLEEEIEMEPREIERKDLNNNDYYIIRQE